MQVILKVATRIKGKMVEPSDKPIDLSDNLTLARRLVENGRAVAVEDHAPTIATKAGGAKS